MWVKLHPWHENSRPSWPDVGLFHQFSTLIGHYPISSSVVLMEWGVAPKGGPLSWEMLPGKQPQWHSPTGGQAGVLCQWQRVPFFPLQVNEPQNHVKTIILMQEKYHSGTLSLNINVQVSIVWWVFFFFFNKFPQNLDWGVTVEKVLNKIVNTHYHSQIWVKWVSFCDFLKNILFVHAYLYVHLLPKWIGPLTFYLSHVVNT